MSVAKTSLIVVAVGTVVLTGLYFLGKSAAEKKSKALEEAVIAGDAAEAEAAAPSTTAAESTTSSETSDTSTQASPTTETQPNKESEVTQAIDIAEPTLSTQPHAAADTSTDVVEQPSRVITSDVVPTRDELYDGIESRYRRLVEAIHADQIPNKLWFVNGPLNPKEIPDADVVSIRGAIIDAMTALRTPKVYFDPKCGEGQIRLGYQFTARRPPVVFIRFEDITFVLCDADARFWVSAPSSEEFRVDSAWYLEQVMDALFEQLGIK